MPKVGPRIALAHPATAIGIEWTCIVSIPCLLDRDFPLGGKQQAMPRRPRGQNAIHHIDAEPGILRDLLRRAHSHHIARLVGRKVLKRSFDDFPRALPRLANTEPADSIARKADFDGPQGRFLSQFEIHPALNDAEQGLAGTSFKFVIPTLPEGKGRNLLFAASVSALNRLRTEN